MDLKNILQKFQSAETVRRGYESIYRDLTKYFNPYRDDFINATGPLGDVTSKRPRTDLYNTEGVNAAEQLTSTICNGLINYARPWFAFSVKDVDTKSNLMVRRFLEKATDITADAINDTSANFYSQAHEFVADLVIYGTACMYVEESKGEEDSDIKFCTIPLAEVYISENNYRQVDSVFRKMKMTAPQIVLQWPDTAPDKIRQAAERGSTDQYDVLHAVVEREIARVSGIKTNKQFAYASFYILPESNSLLSESGYHEMPYIVARWMRRSGELYGRSPAWVALPDVKRANAVEKTLIETSERIGNPPILMSDDGVITQLRLAPGQPVIGGLDSVTGAPRLQPMMVGGNIPVTLQMLQMLNQGIRDRFFVGVLSSYNPGVEKTATEVVEFRREESRLMGPNIGKIQSEMLEPIIDRVRNILSRKRKFPKMPQQLIDVSVELEYSSPLAKMQQGSDVDAITRTLNVMLPFIQTDPTLMDAINGEAAFQHVAEVNGVLAKLIRSPEEIAQRKQARAEQQQLAQTADVMQQASQAQLNISKAQALQNGG